MNGRAIHIRLKRMGFSFSRSINSGHNPKFLHNRIQYPESNGVIVAYIAQVSCFKRKSGVLNADILRMSIKSEE